jgi:hypothetical protein
MSAMPPSAQAGAARRLWSRSPAWRFLVMLAPMLTALFVLYPPGSTRVIQTTTPIASYTPSVSAPAAAPPAAAPPPAESAKPVATAPQVGTTAPSAPAQATPPEPPKTATLSMVTGNAAAAPSDGTGLNPALVGTLFSGTFQLSGFATPLPPGRWAVLAHTTGKVGGGPVMQFALGRIVNGKLSALLNVTTLTGVSISSNIPEAKNCTHPQLQWVDYVFTDGDMVPASHQGCWTLENYYTGHMNQWADRAANMTALDRATAGDLAAKGLSLPQDTVQLHFVKSDASNFVEMRVLFNPEADGISSSPAATVMDSDWAVANVKRYPEKVAYFAKMKAWGASFWPQFSQAFDKGATPASP